MSAWLVVEVLAWCSVPLAAFLAGCAGKTWSMPDRCARFTCWRRQSSMMYRLCRHHLDRQL